MIGRRWPCTALLALLLLLAPALALADADPLVLPRPDEAPSHGSTLPLYDRYQPWAYTYEGQDWSRADYATIYFWMNQLQVAKAWGLKTALHMVEWAVHGELVDSFFDSPGSVLRSFESAVWTFYGSWFTVGALALAGLWALWLHLRGQGSRAWGVIGGSTLILALAAVVVSNGAKSLESGIHLSRGLAVELYEAVDKVTTGTTRQDLVARSGDAAWRVYVYEPWLVGELSEEGWENFRSSDGLDGGQFLALTPEQRHNICLFNLTQGEMYCPWWELDYLPRRMLLSLWTALSGLSVGTVIILLAGSIIAAQLVLLLIMMLSPVWLMAALWWPEGGMRLVHGVLMRAVGAFVAQGMLAATLAVFLALTDTAYSTFDSLGFMFNTFLVLALAAVAFRYRYAWLEPLALVRERAARRAEPLEGQTLRTERNTVRSTRAHMTVVPEAIPVFAVVPETVIARRAAPLVSRQGETALGKERELRSETKRVWSTPAEAFQTQLERLRAELVLRQETILYERTLEGKTAEPVPVAPQPREGRPRTTDQRSDVSRMRPPRPPQ